MKDPLHCKDGLLSIRLAVHRWYMVRCSSVYELELGPFFLPKVATTLTKRRLYWMRRLARPVFFFFFSCFSTLDVCPLTLPARAREPWTLPPRRRPVISTVHNWGKKNIHTSMINQKRFTQWTTKKVFIQIFLRSSQTRPSFGRDKLLCMSVILSSRRT